MAKSKETVLIDGVRHCINSWCVLNNLNPQIYYARQRKNKDWSLFKVLLKPLRGRAKNGVRKVARLNGEKTYHGSTCLKCGYDLKRTCNAHCVYCGD